MAKWGQTGPYGPSRHLQETFQTPSRHVSDTFQTPSKQPPIMANKTPSILLPDTLLPLSRHPTSTFQTPSIHTIDNIQTLTNKFQGQKGSNRSNLGLPDTFQTHFRHLPDTLLTPSRHTPDTFQMAPRHPPNETLATHIMGKALLSTT